MTDSASETTKPAAPALPRWKRVLFSAILLVTVFGTLEMAACVGLKQLRGYDGVHLQQYEFDPYKNILPTRNFVDTRGIRHNSVGFRRSSEVSVEKPAGTYRIFLMGASTAYGLGGLWPHIQREFAVIDNSETIDAYLERTLASALPGMRVEVINAAITSTWTHHHLIYLNQTILKYDPDMVLLMDGFNDFYHFNAGHDQFGSYEYASEPSVILGEPTIGSLLHANGWWFFRKSAAAHVMARAARVLKQAITPQGNRAPMDADKAMAGLERNLPANAFAMLERIGLILRQDSVAAAFILQPMLVLERNRKGMPEIEKKLFEFNVSSYLPNYEQFSHRAVEFVRAEEPKVAERVGAQFIDLTPIFQNVEGQVYTDYCHLTPLGNRLVAEHVAEKILPRIRADLEKANRPSASR